MPVHSRVLGITHHGEGVGGLVLPDRIAALAVRAEGQVHPVGTRPVDDVGRRIGVAAGVVLVLHRPPVHDVLVDLSLVGAGHAEQDELLDHDGFGSALLGHRQDAALDLQGEVDGCGQRRAGGLVDVEGEGPLVPSGLIEVDREPNQHRHRHGPPDEGGDHEHRSQDQGDSSHRVSRFTVSVVPGRQPPTPRGHRTTRGETGAGAKVMSARHRDPPRTTSDGTLASPGRGR